MSQPTGFERETHSRYRHQASHLSKPKLLSFLRQPSSDAGDCSLGSKIVGRTEDDNKVASSIEDRHFIQLMNREMFIDDVNSWVAPLPFRIPRPRLLNNRELALTRFTSLCRPLERKPDMKSHFLAFM